MSAPVIPARGVNAQFDGRSDLPVGAHCLRDGALLWRRRIDWLPADYEFAAANYRKLSRAYEAIAAAVDAERKSRFRGEE